MMVQCHKGQEVCRTTTGIWIKSESCRGGADQFRSQTTRASPWAKCVCFCMDGLRADDGWYIFLIIEKKVMFCDTWIWYEILLLVSINKTLLDTATPKIEMLEDWTVWSAKFTVFTVCSLQKPASSSSPLDSCNWARPWLFFFFFFSATRVACGSSQARGSN